MERNAKKLLQAVLLGFAGGLGKAVGLALGAYLLARLVSWFVQ